MNILYLNHYAGSPEMGMEFRPYYLSKEWVRMGHRVTIIAGDYSHLRRLNPSVVQDFQTETIDGIEYCWIRTGTYEGNGTSRAMTMLRFVRKLKNKARWIAQTWAPDLVIASSTYPLDTYAAQKIAAYSNAKYVHEVHDMWPATLYEVGGMSKKHPFVWLMQRAEDSAYKHCDACVSLLPFAKDYMVEHGLEEGKFINIQNGIAEEDWETTEQIPEEHKRLFETVQDRFVVGYFGGHALSNALDNCLNVAKRVLSDSANDKIVFVLVGDGVEKERLVQRAKEEEITNVHFLPPVSKRAIPNLLKHFDCALITGQPSPLYRFGLSLNKMYDAMMAGLPIILAFDAPETLVQKHNCGIQCDPRYEQAVAQAIHSLFQMSTEELKRMGQNGKDAVLCGYTYRQLADEFLRYITENSRRNDAEG